MANPLSVGAIVGIAVGGAVIVILVVVILVMVTRVRNKSHSFDPYNFVDRPMSGIRGIIVNRKSNVMRKSVTLGRYKVRGDRHGYPGHSYGVWTTDQRGGFETAPLIVPPGISAEQNMYQPSVKRHVDPRVTAVIDLGNSRHFPPRAGMYIRNPRPVPIRETNLPVHDDEQRRISKTSRSKYKEDQSVPRAGVYIRNPRPVPIRETNLLVHDDEQRRISKTSRSKYKEVRKSARYSTAQPFNL